MTRATSCNAGELSLGGYSSGWRSPTPPDLWSLVADTGNDSIDSTVFPNTPGDWSWTSSLYYDFAWCASFRDGSNSIRRLR